MRIIQRDQNKKSLYNQRGFRILEGTAQEILCLKRAITRRRRVQLQIGKTKDTRKGNSMNLMEAIRQRRSIRTFTGRKIPKADLKKMVDAARLSPTGMNRQMWDFVVITEREKLDQILKSLPARRTYTASGGNFDGTSAIIAVVMDGSHKYWIEDGAAATENILLAARGLGWGSCWIEGQMRRQEESLKTLLNVPTEKHILLMVALGEPVSWPPSPPKKALSEVLHWEKCGK